MVCRISIARSSQGNGLVQVTIDGLVELFPFLPRWLAVLPRSTIVARIGGRRCCQGKDEEEDRGCNKKHHACGAGTVKRSNRLFAFLNGEELAKECELSDGGSNIIIMDSAGPGLYILLSFLPNAHHSAEDFARKTNAERQASENK